MVYDWLSDLVGLGVMKNMGGVGIGHWCHLMPWFGETDR